MERSSYSLWQKQKKSALRLFLLSSFANNGHHQGLDDAVFFQLCDSARLDWKWPRKGMNISVSLHSLDIKSLERQQNSNTTQRLQSGGYVALPLQLGWHFPSSGKSAQSESNTSRVDGKYVSKHPRIPFTLLHTYTHVNCRVQLITRYIHSKGESGFVWQRSDIVVLVMDGEPA